MQSSYLGKQNYWVPIEKREAEIPIKKGQYLHPSMALSFL